LTEPALDQASVEEADEASVEEADEAAPAAEAEAELASTEASAEIEIKPGPVLSVDLSQFKAKIDQQLLEAGDPEARRHRARPSSDAEILGDEPGTGIIRGYNDLFAHFHIGGPDGHFVQVERKMPKVFRGVSILGMQRPILSTISFEAFGASYGSGQYQLTVYGPLKSNRLGDDGRPVMKACTKPIRVDVPDPYGDNPPNPDMAVVVEEDSDVMREDGTPPRLQRPRGMTTDADARIHEVTLEHEDRQAEREERRRIAREAREARDRNLEEQRAARETTSTLEVIRDLNEKVVQLAEREKPGADLSGVANVISAVMSSQQGSASQVEALRSHYFQEAAAMRDQHARALEALRLQFQADADRQRSEWNDRVRSMEAQHHRELSDERERSRREIDLVRQDYDRRLQEQDRHFQARISDERRQHDRDLAAKAEIGTTTMSTVQQTFELRLQTKDDELRRLQAELAKAQHELELEKSKDLASRIGEAERLAEALGYVKDEGGKSWQEMLGEAALGVVQKAPELAASVAQAVRPQAPMSPMQQYLPPQPMPQQMGYPMGMPFATEDVPVDFPTVAGPPVGLSEDPFDRGFVPVPIPQSAPPSPQQQQQPVQQPQAQVPSDGGMVTDAQILEFSDEFRDAFEAGKAPEEYAQEIAMQVGPLLKPILASLSIQRVVQVLEADEDAGDDPLLRRDGQKFLTTLWASLAKIAGA
jgi:hypothetical protein